MASAQSDDFTPGRPVALSERVSRVVAPNAGRMTGPGTNSYLIAAGDGGVVVLDAGPADPAHEQALIAAVGDRPVRALVVTHTHIDHSPATAALHRHFAAPRVGRTSRHPLFQDTSFVPEVEAEDGAVVAGGGCTLRAVPTPGHASNHVCWYLEEERALFTGDHILGTVSPVILPPDGSMTAYLDSLERLKSLALETLYPGHGPRLDQPPAVIDALIRHRLLRESKVERALATRPGATLEDLLPVVYADVPVELHAWAGYSLLAHLERLVDVGRASCTDGRWTASA